jgi:hypothetical protein
MEAGGLTRWASAIVRPLVERLIICEPRHNRLINSNPTKSDEADVEGMCLLLRLGKLKEVWMGVDSVGDAQLTVFPKLMPVSEPAWLFNDRAKDVGCHWSGLPGCVEIRAPPKNLFQPALLL